MARKNEATAGQVHSIRFSERELTLLQDAAGRRGGRISDVIHDAIAQYASASGGAVAIHVPGNSKVIVYQNGIASPGTSGSLPLKYQSKQVALTATG